MKPPCRKRFASLCIVFGMALPLRGDWPTLHNDYQRSGHSDEVVRGPYERTWWRDFHDEMIATRCEAIVGNSHIFVGTFAGNLYALRIADGQTAWRFTANGPIGASPSYRDGKLYFGSDDAFDRGTLYCLDATDGDVIWQTTTPGGIWASPACDGSRVYVGDRSGRFHAVNVADGTPAWSLTTGYMILKPASFSTDGEQIVFGSEDMHVYCVSPEGRLIWRTSQLPGLSLRDQGPTIWQGLAIVRTNPADAFHAVLGRNGELLEAIQREIPLGDEDQVLLDKWGDLLLAPRAERRAAENAGVVRYLKQNRHDQSFFALDLEDGSEPWIAPVLFTSGLHNPPTPPTFHPQTGDLYTLSRSALTYYVRGVRRYSCLVRIDRQTGLPNWYWPDSELPNWGAFPMIPDETQALSLMGDFVIGTHQGEPGWLDPMSGAVTSISRTRDTYGGIFGPGALGGSFDEARRRAEEGYLTGMPNEWHGPDRAVLSISDGRMFWIAGSQVVCLAGPDVRQASAGRTESPGLLKLRLPGVVPGGNVADRGRARVDQSLPRRQISVNQLRECLSVSGDEAETPSGDLVSRIRQQLDAQLTSLMRGGDDGRAWAPLVIQLGIGREERHFVRTADTIQIVSLALPHVSPPVRMRAVAYLDSLVAAGCPFNLPQHAADGARREPFDLGPEMADFAQRLSRYEPGVQDVYSLWAYAHYADRWPVVLEQLTDISKRFDCFAADVPAFDPDDMQDDAAEKLNARLAGVLGAVRIFDRAGDRARRDRAWELLAHMVTERVHHERVDHRLVRPTRGESGGIHQAKLPRYVGLVPELSQILQRFAGPALAGHIADLRQALPLWYQAYGERMIGGENYISPPHLARGIFQAWADGTPAAAEDLAAKLDQPWCQADLYYIEKCAAVLRADRR